MEMSLPAGMESNQSKSLNGFLRCGPRLDLRQSVLVNWTRKSILFEWH